MTPLDASPPEPSNRPQRQWGIWLLWLLPGLMLLGVFTYAFLARDGQDTSESTIPQVGKPMADFTLPNLQGREVQLAALRGKVVFINVWATWCPPCIEEMPTIQRLHERLHPKGLEILAVSLDVLGAQVVVPFMQTRRLSFTALLDTKSVVQRLYQTTGVPESFIVDKRGMLVEKIVGPRDWAHPQMLASFERLLATP